MYWELARLRQAMKQVEHIEPTGKEQSRPSTGLGIKGKRFGMPGLMVGIASTQRR